MRHARERAVVAAVAPMAGALGLEAVAEGVERADQVDELIRLGYPLAQGFHFGRPMPATTLRGTFLSPAADRVRPAGRVRA
jgi:sensor c-di-GMP phosphodiesterase-like protein